MRTSEMNFALDAPVLPAIFRAHFPATGSPSFLHLVTPGEIQDLHDALFRHKIPADLQAKLEGLRHGTMIHRFVEQNARLIIALLMAAYDGSFREVDPDSLDRLLRVLAYVRKDADAVPDYNPDGFADDQREIRATINQLSGLLQSFKSWRLRYQVPAMWLS